MMKSIEMNQPKADAHVRDEEFLVVRPFNRHREFLRRIALGCASVMVAFFLTVETAAAAKRTATPADLVQHRILVLTMDPGEANLDPGYIDPPPDDYVVVLNGKMLVVNRQEIEIMISNGFFIAGDLLPNYQTCPPGGDDGGGDTGGGGGPGYGETWIWEHEYVDHLRNGGMAGFLTPEGKVVYFYYEDYAAHMYGNDWWPCG